MEAEEKGHDDSDSYEAKSTSWAYGFKQVDPNRRKWFRESQYWSSDLVVQWRLL